MSTAGPNSPGTAVDSGGGGGNAWTNPANVKVSDANYATVTAAGAGQSTYLTTGTFGFAVTGTVNGIQVDTQAKTSSGTVNLVINLTKDGSTNVAFKNANSATTTEQYWTEGGAADLWSVAWTPTQINSSNFGMRLLSGGLGGVTLSVNHIRITVTYTPPGSTVPIIQTRQAVMRAATR